MSDANSFTKLVPGFDFLQNLVKNAGSALPNIGQWVAPTLNPEELEKRIEELRTVQFWLEQNARMLGATIQALEVQRMTLSTLKTMNVQMEDLRESLKIKLPGAPAEVAAPKTAGQSADDAAAKPKDRSKDKPKKDAPAPGAVDPLQWWTALTQQFTQLATTAMKDGGADASKALAASMARQGVDAAGQTPKKAAGAAGATGGTARKAGNAGPRRAAASRA
jgi:hypothetical protein